MKIILLVILKNCITFVLFKLILFTDGFSQKQVVHNPLCSGYYADTTIIKYKDTFFIHTTIDPWGE
jgi:hypothetical protein